MAQKRGKKEGDNFAQQQEFVAGIEERSRQMLQRLPALGPVLVLYLQSQHRRYQFISDIEWLLLPPLVRDQCKLYMKKEYPVSFVSWAFINEEVEQRLTFNGGKLRNEDWNCGSRICLIDIIAPFGGVETMLRDIQQNVFPGEVIRLLAPDLKTGGVTIREMAPQGKAEPAEDKRGVN